MTSQEIAAIIYQIASALNFMHNKGYVHRDIKPENIAFGSENDFRALKITSFMTSKKYEREEERRMNGIYGSYLYMAPEMIAGEDYDEKVDIWSLGVVAYMLVARHHPLGWFDDDTIRAKLRDKLVEKYKHVPRDDLIDFEREDFYSFGMKLPELLKKMLEISPRKRFSARDIMDHRWVSENYKTYKKKLKQNYISLGTAKKANDEEQEPIKKPKPLKNALYKYFAPQLANEDDFSKFSEMFQDIDKDGDGVLSAEEFEEAMQGGGTIDPEEVKLFTKLVVQKDQ